MSTTGTYDPHAVEAQIYARWELGGYFHASPPPAPHASRPGASGAAAPPADRKPFTIVIPPPNVTGALHLGHALNNTCQDILIRWRRMCGDVAEWMPGTDHAGIATQAVVEKRLRTEEGLTRRELGRDGLVERIWKWKDEYNGRIIDQLRRMGCSCDWARTRFTLDEVCARAVYHAFLEFFRAGLIYRGTRLVNWDPTLQTAVSDDEIVHETVKGHLWHIRYPIEPDHETTEPRRNEAPAAAVSQRGPQGAAGSAPRPHGHNDDGTGLGPDAATAAQRVLPPDARPGIDYLVVATTRPETMLGDTAVAVHPDDERYGHLIGRRCILPLMWRSIPVIADPILVKKEFGTGCVKVTPAHDPNDYACGQRHGLAMINILTPDGKINENGKGTGNREQGTEGEPSSRSVVSAVRSLPAFDYSGMKKEDARKRIVADLEALGLLEKVEPYETEIGHSDRSRTPIEPMLSEQWFLRTDAAPQGRSCGPLADEAMEAVRDGRVRFFPERYAKTYLDWLSEKRDWCISRQLWWGHRIPVWTRRMTLTEENWTTELLPDGIDSLFEQDWGEPERLAWRMIRVRDGATVRDWRRAFFPVVKETEGEYELQVCYVGSDRSVLKIIADAGLRQDPDVLDTWFSSALWPLSTFGWPHGEGPAYGERRTEPSTGSPSPVSCWPSRADFDFFFPTDVLCTGRGIITLWVARMVMMSLFFTRRVPFRHVYIHPIIQDGQGRTMSKSLGNGVDPLDLIELYGTDAMRFVLAQMATETQDIRLPVRPVRLPDGRQVNGSDKFELGRNFCNKLWQAANGFVLAQLDGHSEAPARRLEADAGPDRRIGRSMFRARARDELAVEDHWILSRLSACIEDVSRKLERYQFADAANAIYSFFWSDFCDWYVELVKPRLYASREAAEPPGHEHERSDDPTIDRSESTRAARSAVRRPESGTDDPSADVARQVLVWVLDQTLRLLHPIAPFITEAIWQRLNAAAPRRGIAELADCAAREPMLIAAAWPVPLPREADVEQEMGRLQSVIVALRDILARVNVLRAAAKQAAVRSLPAAAVRCDPATARWLSSQDAAIRRLARCEKVAYGPLVEKPPRAFSAVLGGGLEVYVAAEGLADPAAERARLEKERTELLAHAGRVEAKLRNEGFVSNAPRAVVEQERRRLAELNEKLAALQQHLAELQ